MNWTSWDSNNDYLCFVTQHHSLIDRWGCQTQLDKTFIAVVSDGHNHIHGADTATGGAANRSLLPDNGLRESIEVPRSSAPFIARVRTWCRLNSGRNALKHSFESTKSRQQSRWTSAPGARGKLPKKRPPRRNRLRVKARRLLSDRRLPLKCAIRRIFFQPVDLDEQDMNVFGAPDANNSNCNC